jgi:CRISPR-associated protein Csd1
MPATTFPHLIDLGIFHLMKIKQDRIALAIWFEQQIEAITAPLPVALPSLLTVERQGRFAIGYWHQRYARRPGSATAEEAAPLEAIGDNL